MALFVTEEQQEQEFGILVGRCHMNWVVIFFIGHMGGAPPWTYHRYYDLLAHTVIILTDVVEIATVVGVFLWYLVVFGALL